MDKNTFFLSFYPAHENSRDILSDRNIVERNMMWKKNITLVLRTMLEKHWKKVYVWGVSWGKRARGEDGLFKIFFVLISFRKFSKCRILKLRKRVSRDFENTLLDSQRLREEVNFTPSRLWMILAYNSFVHKRGLNHLEDFHLTITNKTITRKRFQFFFINNWLQL